jgi:hypothetical protein
MTNVRAGSRQSNLAVGDCGIVTLWLRAPSESDALALAQLILTTRRYASIGELQAFAEVLDYDPLACSTEQERAAERNEDWILAGYDAIKERAITQADGLHEVWLGAASHEAVRQAHVA